jgi:glycosyltransferase involved in cell wall biosynthesis
VATIYVTGTRPMARPNAPRPSRHRVLVEMDYPARFVVRRAIEKCWPPLAAVSWPHPRNARYDLVHGLNAIPLTSKPFVTTFESTLPRALGPGGERVAHAVRDRLVRPNCRALIAMSQYAKGKLEKANRGWPGLDATLAKVVVIYPHFDERPATIRRYTRGETLRLIFVGNHFAQKGGIAALRALRRAAALGLPVTLDVFSGMRVGSGVYADHPDARRYRADLAMLASPGVTWHGRRPNAEVLDALGRAHLQVLATLDDTFGYGVVEGLSVGTPAIVSNVCAMPEIVPPSVGARLDLPVDEWGNWTGLARRRDPDFWNLLDATYDGLADGIVRNLAAIADDPARIERWSAGALERFREEFESKAVSARLDDVYDAALN